MYSSSSSSVVSLAKFAFGEVLGEFFFIPVWWYSRGFLRLSRHLGRAGREFEKSIGFRFWLRTIGKPMYGQRDVAGKIISFLMRLVVLAAKFFALAGYAVFLIVLALLWLAAPLVIIWQLVKNLTGLLVF
ncbi:hypothetical protein HY628_02935 [Candidatus Uhrbacteria bacterium]|nr:hypothetical protein [Candidatus Uhrbacteria bacterium]